MQLSRDHHLGLLLCWKIRTGLSNNIDEERIKAYVVAAYAQELKEHFYQEEQLLFNPMPEDDLMVCKAIEQHSAIRDLEQQISVAQQPAKELLTQFADLLEQHIRYEERELFPYLEAALDAETLSIAGAAVDKYHETAEPLNWSDEFWIRKR